MLLWHDLNISLPGVHSRGGLELGSTLGPRDTVESQVAWKGLGRNPAERGLVTKRFEMATTVGPNGARGWSYSPSP